MRDGREYGHHTQFENNSFRIGLKRLREQKR